MKKELGATSAIWLTVMRVVTGWFMLYAGITQIIDPNWSAAGYLTNAQTFPEFYRWLAEPERIGAVNFLNEWGLTFLGASLIVGLGVRLSSALGIMLMALYYFPVVRFPFAPHGFIVEEHVVYATMLAFLAAVRAGRYYGLERWCANLPVCSKFPKLRNWIG